MFVNTTIKKILLFLFFKIKKYKKTIKIYFNRSLAYFDLCHASQFKRNDNKKIRVGFIVQMPEIWDKEAPIFEAMQKDSKFDPLLIIVPSYDISKSNYCDYGYELDFFLKKYSNSNIIVAYENKHWRDLKELKLDYVFYQRCWESYLPVQYHTKNVIKYSKTCYIPYCFHALDLDESYYNTNFFTYLYMFFCCSKDQYEEVPYRKYRHCVFLGYPSLDNNSHYNDLFADGTKKTILWTPRWVNDDNTGGSTFLKYLYNIPELISSHDNIRLLLRPHPLSFQYAVKTGALTNDEVMNYKNRMKELGITFDDNAFIEETLKVTDILISDFSSILIHYYLLGKPLIYCSSTDVKFSRTYKYIIQSSYIAKNWDDVIKYSKMLICGKDPLAIERKNKIESICNEHVGAIEKIIKELIENVL